MNTVVLSPIRWVPFVIALLICPSILLVCVLLLPPFTWLYGTLTEKAFLLSLLTLPFVGVIGIVRYVSLARGVKAVLAITYLALMAMPVLFTAIFVGCSWARACF